MNRFKNNLTALFAVGLMFFGLMTQANAQISRANQREVNDILRRLNVRVDDFRYQMEGEFRRAATNRAEENEINGYLTELQNDLSGFQDKFDRRREAADDASQVLMSAKSIDDFLNRRRYSQKIQTEWNQTRALFDQLASNYGVRTFWNNRGSQYPNNTGGDYPNGGGSSQTRGNRYPGDNRYPAGNSRFPQNNSYNDGLTGTYQLDTARSENTRDIAERAINDIDTTRRDESRRDLEDKLESPEQLAIDVRGNQITLASTRAPQITFTADGQDRSETLPDGRTVRLRTTLRGQDLTVSSIGGDNDYTVTFSPLDKGRSLKVTRRITTEYLKQTIFAESVYTKTDSSARLDVFNNPNSSTAGNYPNNNTNNYPTDNYPPSGNYPPTAGSRRSNGQFIVPNGTILTGNIENLISTKVSQNNDRFRMTVTAPNQYRGSVVEGYISGINRSGKVSGRSQLTFNFESIRLTNGNTYDFAGFLQSVTDTNGKTVQVDTEGAARGNDQTKETVKRGGIGAGIGAIIGAIAGGGKGAAIGAILGGGAGAGSVYVQGNEDLELPAGSSVTVQATSPNNR